MVVRPARPEEDELVLAFWRVAATGTRTTDDLAGLAALRLQDGEALLVAELDGEVVGTLIASWDGWRGHMYRLAVSPERRRSGIASALVAEGERRLVAAGARRVNALVEDENELGVAFWGAGGYAFDEGMRRYVKTFPDHDE